MSAPVSLLTAHQRIYQWTGGWLGHLMLGVPTLLLTTSGRRSGQPRTVALVYARDGNDLLVVASNGGRDRAPAWLFNLEASNRGQAQVKRRRERVTSRSVYPGDTEYDRLLALCDQANRGRYGEYRRRTARPIPVVVLTPMAPRKKERSSNGCGQVPRL